MAEHGGTSGGAGPTDPRRRETLLRVLLATMLALSCVSFIEPSPYEIFFFLLLPIAALAGLGFSRTRSRSTS